MTASLYQVIDGNPDPDEEDEVESILLEPTHKWWNLWALFKRVFRSHRFKVRLGDIVYRIYSEKSRNFQEKSRNTEFLNLVHGFLK